MVNAALDDDVVSHLDIPEFPKRILERDEHGTTGVAVAAGR
jgi:hypothetical protein